MDKIKAVKVIKKFVETLKQEGISIDRVILYGSYASGRMRPDSDIDVAVVSRNFGKDRVEEGMTLFRIAGKKAIDIFFGSFQNSHQCFTAVEGVVGSN